jgi:5'-3' exoribonuclease 2
MMIYKSFLPKMKGYLTHHCRLNMENVNFLMKQLSLVEEELGTDNKPNNSNYSNQGRNDRYRRDNPPVPERNVLESEVLAVKYKQDFSKGNWRLSYYQNKFHIQESDLEDFISKISKAYLEGINWVYQYYYRGCPSWDWFYPFHYAPLAIDLVDRFVPDKLSENGEASKIGYEFPKGIPYNPVEQLMSVLPKQSSHALPKALRQMLFDSESEIIDFYPIKFPLDTNGFKFAWMGVNLLPFVNEKRLLKAVKSKESEFSDIEKVRNTTGYEQLLFNFQLLPALAQILEECNKEEFKYDLKSEEGH